MSFSSLVLSWEPSGLFLSPVWYPGVSGRLASHCPLVAVLMGSSDLYSPQRNSLSPCPWAPGPRDILVSYSPLLFPKDAAFSNLLFFWTRRTRFREVV